MKTQKKSHGNEVTDFYDQEIPKVDSNHICLAVIASDSSLKKDSNYYPQVFLKECKDMEKNVIKHIIDDLESSFDDSYDSDDSDEE